MINYIMLYIYIYTSISHIVPPSWLLFYPTSTGPVLPPFPVERLPSNSTDGVAAPGTAKRRSAWRPSNPGPDGAGILEDHHVSKQRFLGGLNYVKMPVIMRCQQNQQIILVWCKTYVFFRMSDNGFHDFVPWLALWGIISSLVAWHMIMPQMSRILKCFWTVSWYRH